MNLLLAINWASIGRSALGIVLAIIILLAMVSIHEFGHYLAGKLLNFKITEFAIGFGPAILKKRSKKTGELFAVRIIPLGGYCAFDGEDYDEEDSRSALKEQEEKQAEEPFEGFSATSKPENEPTVSVTNEKTDKNTADEYPEPKGVRFNDQAPWKRIIVLVAGALMNYVLAMVLLLIMCFSYGVPMCIAIPTDYDSNTMLAPVAWEVETLSAADIIVEMDGTKVGMLTDCMDALKGKSEGDSVSVEIYRLTEEGWKEKTVTLTLLADANFKNSADVDTLKAVMGLQIGTQSVKTTFGRTVGGAFAYSGEMATSVLKTLGELITGAFGDQTADVVGGPVSTIGQTAKIAVASPFSFLYMASFIGVNLAVFNLLPIPALDGSKVIFCIIEWIRKKPINRKIETAIHFAGIVFLFGFAILIDVLKLF